MWTPHLPSKVHIQCCYIRSLFSRLQCTYRKILKYIERMEAVPGLITANSHHEYLYLSHTISSLSPISQYTNPQNNICNITLKMLIFTILLVAPSIGSKIEFSIYRKSLPDCFLEESHLRQWKVLKCKIKEVVTNLGS